MWKLKKINWAEQVVNILVVVIGILIAISLANWKENKTNNRIAKQYYVDFKHDLTNDIETLKKNIETLETQLRNIDTITSVLVNPDISSNETLNFALLNQSLIFETFFIPEKSTYNQLVSSSHSNLINDKKLKEKLFEYYTFNERNEKNNEVSIQLYQHLYITPEIARTIFTTKEYAEALGFSVKRPNIEIESLIENTEYYWILGAKRNMSLDQKRHYSNAIKLADKIIELIERQ
ncbi:MAG: hypothetical protein HKN54_10140 [Flavobacteriaceae bacterium]|nr:hypothetical protein [Flavobacteriaceae bacterium]